MADSLDFESLVAGYYEPLYQFAFSLTRDEADACDLVQHTFCVWAKKGHQLRDGTKVKTWLFTTLHREFLGARRKETRFPHVDLEYAMAELPAVSPATANRLDTPQMLVALSRLDEIYQAPVALFYLQDYSYMEIAAILEVPLGTVKSRLSRGLIHIIIRDNGPGISAENLLRIFDPFFTTKNVGQGTGLGLSLCYGIIKEHGGNITPSSRPGEGATFTIELPILHLNGDAIEAAAGTKSKTLNPNEGVGKRILVIDDEESILQMLHERLSQSGYSVDTASDGENALRQMRQKNYDVTFCDWKMPGLNGRQIYEKLREANPERCRRIVFFSGDVINEQMRGFLEQENRSCLAKPFTFEDIHAAIKTILTT